MLDSLTAHFDLAGTFVGMVEIEAWSGWGCEPGDALSGSRVGFPVLMVIRFALADHATNGALR